MDSLPVPVQPVKKGPRTSVSAEAFGMWNRKEEFKARVIEKSEETKDKISSRLKQSFIFQALNEEEFSIVVNAMEEKRFVGGDKVIEQGEDGNELFVVEQGKLSCYKQFSGHQEPTFLRKYEPGDAFGELALLYNAPRAATIICDSDCLLWSLDRNTFNHIVKDSSRVKRERYEQFLQKVKVLETMEPYERAVISDALNEEKCLAGDCIIRLGEEGNKFYIVEEGEVVATIIDEHGQEKEVARYRTGDYFGERALIKNEPRGANCIAVTDCKLVTLDRHTFKRLMGPLDTLMKRRIDTYQHFVQTQNAPFVSA